MTEEAESAPAKADTGLSSEDLLGKENKAATSIEVPPAATTGKPAVQGVGAMSRPVRRLQRSFSDTALISSSGQRMLPLPFAVRKAACEADRTTDVVCSAASLLLENKERNLKYGEMLKRAERLRGRSGPPPSASAGAGLNSPLETRVTMFPQPRIPQPKRSGSFGGFQSTALQTALAKIELEERSQGVRLDSPTEKPEDASPA
eukprot:CAMPEP_0114542114 /NCGR_PEP_ID=MMETSP0114-20121206/1667_1 /TAXON_ID=31324 /ORGANISM="Goniomonas sp, Strain m" /LENGTH=203 /DNA_ID=CAMNT_0001726399 /DNA_START=19 /DNA_END=630 /DNA_ORIENTATION=-